MIEDVTVIASLNYCLARIEKEARSQFIFVLSVGRREVPYLHRMPQQQKGFRDKNNKNNKKRCRRTTSAIRPAEQLAPLSPLNCHETKESRLPSVPNCTSGRRSSPGTALEVFCSWPHPLSQIRSGYISRSFLSSNPDPCRGKLTEATTTTPLLYNT